jgi:hypothetical protein
MGFVQREKAYVFVDGTEEREVNQHLLMGGERSLNKALNQPLNLQAAMAVTGPPARLREVRAGAHTGTRTPVIERHRAG